jgi:hypothetical protein
MPVHWQDERPVQRLRDRPCRPAETRRRGFAGQHAVANDGGGEGEGSGGVVSRAADLFRDLRDRGETAIDDLIDSRQSEELFLDFKRSSNNGVGRRLSDDDRNNLGKAISGFGNSEGGVIIWGVDCRPDQARADVATAKVPIEDAVRFKSWLEGVTSGVTIPAHPTVEHLVVHSTGAGGFVATHVPKSYLAPHQCLSPMQFYMRAGSNFLPVPHAVLSGLFGRTPQPNLVHMWSIPPAQIEDKNAVLFKVGLLLANRSPAVARDVYVSVRLTPPGGGSQVACEFPNLEFWEANQVFGFMTQIISREGRRLAPQAIAQPAILSFRLIPPFLGDYSISITLGCHGSPCKQFAHKLNSMELTRLHTELLAGTLDQEMLRSFAAAVVGAVNGNERAEYNTIE